MEFFASAVAEPQRANVSFDLPCGKYRRHPPRAGQRPVHRIGYHAEVQLSFEAAGLPAGAGPCVQSAPRPQRD